MLTLVPELHTEIIDGRDAPQIMAEPVCAWNFKRSIGDIAKKCLPQQISRLHSQIIPYYR